MIVATAGHVDHGKTLLVKALTGVDTDRLPEEKKRNLTIDLGFAYLPIGPDQTIGFIDVPGHERFIRNALCGLAGTDFVLFIVAADDGVMPQTREHLAIVDLLGIRHGAVALTKTDRVSADRVDEVTRNIAELFQSTTLASAPVFAVSAMTGDGIADLRAHLEAGARATPPRDTRNNFRLAIDRHFDVAGAGLVVTGTVFSGRVSVGDSVEVLGGDMKLRVRGIHAQNSQADVGQAGQRCAINLAGPELRKEQIGRGDWLVTGDVPPPQRKIDCELRVLASEPRALAHWTPVHVHVGAAETTGRVAVLEGKNIAPGQSGRVQLVLHEAIGCVHGDRMIIRDQSATRTIGGGRVIDVFAPLRGRAKTERLNWLGAMAVEDDSAAVAHLLQLAPAGVDLARFGANRNLTRNELERIEKDAVFKVITSGPDRIGFSDVSWKGLRNAVVKRLEDWHKSSPSETGLGANRICERTGIRLSREAAAAVAGELVREGALVRDGHGVRLPKHTAQLQGADAALWKRVEAVLAEAALRPVTAREISEQSKQNLRGIESFLQRAGRLGLIARISKTRYATPAALNTLAHIAEGLATSAPDGVLMVAAFRDASGVGRNMTIEILEHFDKQKFTQRVGEGRKVISSADKAFAAH